MLLIAASSWLIHLKAHWKYERTDGRKGINGRRLE
jgi:hypothetical protein